MRGPSSSIKRVDGKGYQVKNSPRISWIPGQAWNDRRYFWIPRQARNDWNDASQRSPSAFIGREEASQPRHEGEDGLSSASSAAPEGGARLRATKPDNRGGTFWFVLLAAEKNEHLPALHPGISWIPRQARYDTTRHPAPRCGVQQHDELRQKRRQVNRLSPIQSKE